MIEYVRVVRARVGITNREGERKLHLTGFFSRSIWGGNQYGG